MPPADPPARQWTFGTPVDLAAVLDDHRIEHLTVDEQRTFVLYHAAILNLVVTDDTLSTARVVTVESWESSHRTADPKPEAVLTAFGEVIAGD